MDGFSYKSHNNDSKISTVNVCVDGKLWTKTLVFNECYLVIRVIWNNELGKQVKAPNKNLISSEQCCGCNDSEDVEGIEIRDVFDNHLATVVNFNNQ